MIASPKRLLPEALGAFALQIGLAKYPYLLSGDRVPFNMREFLTMAAMAVVAALLLENMIYRLNELTSQSKRQGKGK